MAVIVAVLGCALLNASHRSSWPRNTGSLRTAVKGRWRRKVFGEEIKPCRKCSKKTMASSLTSGVATVI